MITKKVDAKGRLLISPEWAGRLVIIDDTDPNKIIITHAAALPAHEVWLYENEEAAASIHRGLEQAKKGELT